MVIGVPGDNTGFGVYMELFWVVALDFSVESPRGDIRNVYMVQGLCYAFLSLIAA